MYNTPKLFIMIIVDALRSLQVVVAVITAIILLSIIGTIVPQQQTLPDSADAIIQNRNQIDYIVSSHPTPWKEILSHIQLYNLNAEELELYLHKYGQLRFTIIKILGFTDIFNVWYYNLLIIWVGISAIICTYYRFNNIIKSQSKLSRRALIRGWASFFFHSSLVLILVSGVVSKLFGVTSFVTLENNKPISIVIDPKVGKNWLLQLIIAEISKPKEFEIELKQFDIPLEKLIKRKNDYENNDHNHTDGMISDRLVIRDYISHLQIKDNGEVFKGSTSMNRPFVYKGIKFYQMSYQLNAIMSITEIKTKTNRLLPMTLNLPVQASEQGYLELPPGAQPQSSTDPVYELIDFKYGEIWQANNRIGTQSPLAQINVYDPSTGEITFQTRIDTIKPVQYKQWQLKMTDKVEYQSILSYKSAPGEILLYFSIGLLIISSSVITLTAVKS